MNRKTISAIKYVRDENGNFVAVFPIITADEVYYDIDNGIKLTDHIDELNIGVYRCKGSVSTIADLPSVDLNIGDVYIIEQAGELIVDGVSEQFDAGSGVIWDGEKWLTFSASIDPTLYYKKDETYNKTEIDSKVIEYNNSINTELEKYYTKTEVDGKIDELNSSISDVNDVVDELTAITNGILGITS